MTHTALDLVESYLRRFVAYPSEHALVAHALWIAHAHLLSASTRRPGWPSCRQRRNPGRHARSR